MGQPAGFKDSNHLLNSEKFSSNHFKSGGLNTPSEGEGDIHGEHWFRFRMQVRVRVRMRVRVGCG